MNAPLISVVVPVHNREHVVISTLNSIKAQTHRPIRLIVVDNNSADGSLKAVKEWGEANCEPDFEVIVESELRPGAPIARNAGMSLVNTPWVMFFDSDDTMQPRHIERAVECIQLNPEADIIGWDVNMHMLSGGVSVKPFMSGPDIYECIMEGTMATQRYICRSELVRRVGGWDVSVMRWNDIELGTRILLLPELNVVYADDPISVDVYCGAQSISGTDYHSTARECEHSLDIISSNLPPYLRFIVQLKRAVLAALYFKEGHAADSRRLFSQALSESEGSTEKSAVKMAYHYTRRGGRGAAKILKYYYRLIGKRFTV